MSRRGAIAGAAAALVLLGGPSGAAAETYVSLGDSYSSGTGTRDYYDSDCERSHRAFPHLIAPQLPGSHRMVDCSGARTNHITVTPRHGNPPQADELGPDTEYASVTIGGNDAGFGNVMRDCAAPGLFFDCHGAIDAAQAYIQNELPARLDAAYARIREAAPSAAVAVVGYPRLFRQGSNCNFFARLSTSDITKLNQTADLLAVTTRGRARAHGFTFVDSRPAFNGHGVCDSEEWINGLSNPIGESYHPNRDGHLLGWSGIVRAALLAAPSPNAARGPNGRIAFTRGSGAERQIHLVNGDGSFPLQLTDAPGGSYDPAFSPDGERIAFVSERDGNPEVYAMSWDGGEQTRLTSHPLEDMDPAWSPNGELIAFRRNTGSEAAPNNDIFKMSANGGSQVRLTNNAASEFAPAWSPDGSEIAYQRCCPGANQVFKMSADGQGQVNLSDNPANDGRPAWSPDGTRIAFHSNREGSFEIFRMTSDGGTQTRLTANAADDRSPTYAPDGDRIAFHSNRDGQAEVYTMTPAGGGQARLTDDPAGSHAAAWQGDSTPPETTIEAGPEEGEPIANQRPDFEFSSSEPGSSFECRLDDEPFEPCESPFTTERLGDGEHSFRVRAVDPSGNPDPDPAARTFTVVTGAPVATIESAPIGPTTSTEATFEFSAVGAAGFDCRLDSGWSECSSPEVYEDLDQGQHQFRVRAVDEDENLGPVASHSWTIDAAAGDAEDLIAFSSDRTGNHEIHVMTPTGAGVTQLTDNAAADTNPVFSPDGTRIAFVSDRDGNNEIYAMDRDGSNQTRLTNHAGDDLEPAWSPDGSKIAIRREVSSVVDVFTIDAVDGDAAMGGSEQNLTNAPCGGGTCNSFWPAWSPNGERIAFQRFAAGAGNNVYVMDADGSSQVNLTQGAFQNQGQPDWSPDGAKLAFRARTSTSTDPHHIYTMNPDGSAIVQRSASPRNEENPSWSPDGDRIAFYRAVAHGQAAPLGVPDVFVGDLDPNGSGTFDPPSITNITNGGPSSVDQHPSWHGLRSLTTITGGPEDGAAINDPTPTFEFESEEQGTGFECELDGEGFEPCESPHTTEPLPDGPHQFSVRLLDLEGEPEAVPARRGFTVDTVAPVATIGQGPDDPTNLTEATFTFSADESPVGFECRLDRPGVPLGNWQPCTSPRHHTGLGEGSHEFHVRATDEAGNVGEPASRSWTVTLGVVGNPGPFTASVPGGVFRVKQNAFDLGEIDPDPTVSGTVASDGTVHFPIGGITFPPLDFDTGQGVAKVHLVPTHAWTGNLNPVNGVMTLRARFRLKITGNLGPGGFINLGENCTIGTTADPIDLNVAITGTTSPPGPNAPITGIPYDAEGGEARIVNNSFRVRQASGCPSSSFPIPYNVNNEINNALGLPSEPGNNEGQLQLAFSPKVTSGGGAGPIGDGDDLIAFDSDRSGNAEIYLLAPATGTLTRLTENAADDTNPAISPDGTRIAFVSDRDGNDEIYVMDRDGSNQTRLTVHALIDTDPSWSPDGAQLAIRRQLSAVGSDNDIFAIDATDGDAASGGSEANLTANADSNFAPDWSPDGTRIAYQRFRSGSGVGFGNEVMVMNADGSGQTNLTNNANSINDGQPAWSPDGTRIAFRNDAIDGSHDIYTMSPDGGNLVRRSTSPRAEQQPAWAPDGARIAFARDLLFDDPELEAPDVFTMELDPGSSEQGASFTNLTASASTDRNPSWAIDFDPPGVTLGSVPPELSNDPTPRFEFFAQAEEVGFSCRLDAEGPGGWQPCSSPHTSAQLDDGPHRFEVRAVGPLGNRGPAVAYQWALDTVAPTVVIDSAPDSLTGSAEAAFAFSADKDPVEFACRLDGPGGAPEQGWEPCASPFQAAGLEPGAHRFEVRATDAAGNVSEAAAHEWTIEEAVVDPPAGTPRQPVLSLRVIRVAPKARRVAPGRPVRLRVVVSNRGEAATRGRVRLCLRGPAPRRLKVRGKRCRPLPALAPGATLRRVFRVRPTRRASGRRLVLRFLARSPGVAGAGARAPIRVR